MSGFEPAKAKLGLGLTQKQLHILYADAPRLAALRKLGISRHSSAFAPCHPGVATPKIANYFLREPLDQENRNRGSLAETAIYFKVGRGWK